MKRLLDFLGEVAKRPAMYVYPVTFRTMKSFLCGVRLTARTLDGLTFSAEQYLAAAKELGWDARGNIGIERDFIRRQLSDLEMVDALIGVEIAVWRRALQESNHASRAESTQKSTE